MKHLLLTLSAFIICTSSFAGSFGGDVLTTKDGSVIEGKIKEIKNSAVVFFTDINTGYIVPANSIATIQFEKTRGKAYRQYIDLESESEFMLQMSADGEGTSISEWPLISRISLGIICGLILTRILYGPF